MARLLRELRVDPPELRVDPPELRVDPPALRVDPPERDRLAVPLRDRVPPVARELELRELEEGDPVPREPVPREPEPLREPELRELALLRELELRDAVPLLVRERDVLPDRLEREREVARWSRGMSDRTISLTRRPSSEVRNFAIRSSSRRMLRASWAVSRSPTSAANTSIRV